MKTYTNLYDKITDFNNLLRSAKNAQKGKRFQLNVAHFNLQLESEILQLQRELHTQTYRPATTKPSGYTNPKSA